MSPAFDYLGTLKRFGNDRQLFCEMVGFFFEDIQPWLNAIKQGLAENDAAKIQRASHTIKGMVANFGASRSMVAAAQLEQHAAMGNLPAVVRAFPLLEEAIAELERALAVHRNGAMVHDGTPAHPTNN